MMITTNRVTIHYITLKNSTLSITTLNRTTPSITPLRIMTQCTIELSITTDSKTALGKTIFSIESSIFIVVLSVVILKVCASVKVHSMGPIL